jgi:photosystem II stability/assembly factor-like uncharacterized protein
VVTLLALVALAGCGTGADEHAARRSVSRFEAAIAAKDGTAACHELSSKTTSSVESSEKKPCEQAILSVGLKPSRAVEDASVWVTGAQVKLGGDTLFLDDTAKGWKISAAGCKLSSPDEPYDCDLED